MKKVTNNNILNWEQTLVMCSQKADLAADLINMLKADLSRQRNALHKAYADNNIMAMRDIIHQMQGTCSYISLPTLNAETEQFQHLLHNESSNLQAGFQDLDAAIAAVLTQIDSPA